MSDLKQHKVLIVDDEVEILKALNRGLYREPYEKIFVDSGAKAIEVFASHEISVIITDMRMPGMNGLELLEMIADISPNTVKIVLTGYTKLPQILATVNKVDVFKFLTKPWNLEAEVKVYIREAIDLYENNREISGLLNSEEKKKSIYQKLLTDGYEKVDHFMNLYEKLVKVINYHHLITVEELRGTKKLTSPELMIEKVDESIRHLSVRMNFINRVFGFSKYALKTFTLSDIANIIEKQIDYKLHVEMETLTPEVVYHDNLKQLMGILAEILDFPLLNRLKIEHILLKEEERESEYILFFKMISQTDYQMIKALNENHQFVKMVIQSVGGIIDHEIVDEKLFITVAYRMKIKGSAEADPS
ncbi:MAG: hypothetical protein PWP38_1788 [Clostridiales bacterium]|nr:hypothetical protein [Clostridiales bacterium]